MADKTNFKQSLMHMIKGNIGAGILAMPAAFSHLGLLSASIALPLACAICCYSIHVIVKSAHHLVDGQKLEFIDYNNVVVSAFRQGPPRLRFLAGSMARLVDIMIVTTILGICCVYLVFVTSNLHAISQSYVSGLTLNHFYLALMPVLLAMAYIRTLRRLAILSAISNGLQVTGIALIVIHLIREPRTGAKVVATRPIADMTMGLGTILFSFEGVAVVLPIYRRMKRPEMMGGYMGVINIALLCILVLCMSMGVMGYLQYGDQVLDSITLNLPQKPYFDGIRALYTGAILLSYALQFFVCYEIMWPGIESRLQNLTKKGDSSETLAYRYEYLGKVCIILLTNLVAHSVSSLNIMMDLVGSVSGAFLSIIFPNIIYMVTFWNVKKGWSKALMVVTSSTIALLGIGAGLLGAYYGIKGIKG